MSDPTGDELIAEGERMEQYCHRLYQPGATTTDIWKLWVVRSILHLLRYHYRETPR